MTHLEEKRRTRRELREKAMTRQDWIDERNRARREFKRCLMMAKVYEGQGVQGIWKATARSWARDLTRADEVLRKPYFVTA